MRIRYIRFTFVAFVVCVACVAFVMLRMCMYRGVIGLITAPPPPPNNKVSARHIIPHSHDIHDTLIVHINASNNYFFVCLNRNNGSSSS